MTTERTFNQPQQTPMNRLPIQASTEDSRLQIATAALNGLLVNNGGSQLIAHTARRAVEYADALLGALYVMHGRDYNRTVDAVRALPATPERTVDQTPTPIERLNAKPLHHRRSWTDEDDRLLRKLFSEKTPYGEISRALGRSKGSCWNRVWELQLNKTVLRPRGSLRWTRDEDKQLADMVQAKAPLERIAKNLRRTVPAVYSRLSKLTQSTSAGDNNGQH